MNRSIVIAVLSFALAAPAGAAAPQHCLKDNEVVTEQAVRHGVFLREVSARCDGFVAGTAQLWRDFNQTFGDRLKRQTDAHDKWIKRQFGDDWVAAAAFYDGRLVTAQRNLPLTEDYCEIVKGLLEDNKAKGWGSFTRQAKWLQGEVTLDFRLCNPKR